VSWGEVFLGVIAAATLCTAIIQIGAIVAGVRLARQIQRLADRVDRELKPFFGHLDAIGREASRTASMASARVERLDAAVDEVVGSLERTVSAVQTSFAGSIREGAAVMRGFQAALSSLREARAGRTGPGAEGEDALFI
jgi:hypothetical protein